MVISGGRARDAATDAHRCTQMIHRGGRRRHLCSNRAGSFLFVWLCFLFLSPLAIGQTRSDDQLRAYLITMGPGEELFERFGHNAIWVHDPHARPEHRDLAFHYGLFDFSGDFYWRFARGEMRYSMGVWDATATLDEYRKNDRTVWVQELRLSQSEIRELRKFLVWNYQEANRFYPYDPYRDNCSTRVRDALDKATGGQIRRQTQDVSTAHTYRWHTRRIVRENIWAYTGLECILGEGVDRPISQWDEMFLPDYLRRSLNGITILDDQGNRAALVKSEDLLYQAKRADVADAAPAWGKWYLLAGLAIGGAMLALAQRRGKWARRFVIAMILAWAILIGGAGWLLIGFVTLTRHWATYYNENLLQCSPLAIAFVFCAIGAVHGRPGSRRRAMTVAWLVLGSSVAGVALKALPAMDQGNWLMIALVLPVHAALAIMFTWQLKGQQ